MTERLVIKYKGEPGGLRRAVSNAFRLAERDVAEPEPVDQRVTIRVTDQPSPARSPAVGTTRIRNDQVVELDVDFQGRVSGKPQEVEIEWEISDPNSIGGQFETDLGGDDSSRARYTPVPGETGGIVTISWSADVGNEVVQGSETIEVESESIVLASQNATVTDQPAA